MSLMTLDGQDYLLNLISAREPSVERYYIGVMQNEPGVTIAGSELEEPQMPSYARGVLENISGNWDVIHGMLSNVVDVDFPIATEDWGPLRYWAVTDQPEGGRVLWIGDMTDEVYIAEGDQLTIPAYGLGMFLGETQE